MDGYFLFHEEEDEGAYFYDRELDIDYYEDCIYNTQCVILERLGNDKAAEEMCNLSRRKFGTNCFVEICDSLPIDTKEMYFDIITKKYDID